MGAVSVPADALWGAQTQRSCNNFAIGDQRMPAELIHALARIKGCCAEINGHHGLLNPDQVQAIEVLTLPRRGARSRCFHNVMFGFKSVNQMCQSDAK